MVKLRWGILSAGKICNDFAVGLSTLNPEEHSLEAVAARSVEKAEEFAKIHKIPRFYGSYDELAADKDVDVVYVGSINPEHKWQVLKMLENNKHVLCEKPLCLNYNDTKELCDYAKKQKLFLMEAIWSRFFPSYIEMQKMIKNNEIGDVTQLTANFGVYIEKVDRISKRELGGGTIHDLGIYTLQLTQLIFGRNYESITAVGHLNQDGVDDCVAVIVKYGDGKMAVLTSNSRVNGSNVAEIVGSKGYIQLPTFWCPDKLITANETKTFELPPTKLSMNFINSTGLSYEAEEVRKCISEGKLESSVVPHEDTLQLAKWRDEIRKQIGMVQPGDK